MRQSTDPEFACSNTYRIREGSHTDDGVGEIKSLADIDTSHWPNGFVKVYLITVYNFKGSTLEYILHM